MTQHTKNIPPQGTAAVVLLPALARSLYAAVFSSLMPTASPS